MSNGISIGYTHIPQVEELETFLFTKTLRTGSNVKYKWTISPYYVACSDTCHDTCSILMNIFES